MHQRLLISANIIIRRWKTRLPELDFTKPTSDRMKKFSFTKRSDKNTDDKALLHVSLRGQCLFGLHPVQAALQARRRQFYQLFFSDTSDNNRPLIRHIHDLAKEFSIPIQYTNTNILEELSFGRPHQGVCLDCSPLLIQDIEQENTNENPSEKNRIVLDLCLVKIHDPMNLGAILRTAHFFGIDRILLTHGTCQPSPVASKASSGALELISIYSCLDLDKYLKSLHNQQNVALICATHRGTNQLRTLRLNDMKAQFSPQSLQRIVILVGNEHEGIPDDIAQMCHYRISIEPSTQSEISSLNASVACALFLYHISAQITIDNN